MLPKAVADCALHSQGGHREHDNSSASAGGTPGLGAAWPAEKAQAPAAFSMSRQECASMAQEHRSLWGCCLHVSGMCVGS